MALIHTHTPAVAPVQPPNHLRDAQLYYLFSFSLILHITRQVKKKYPYLVGCTCMGLEGFTHTQYKVVIIFSLFSNSFVNYIWRQWWVVAVNFSPDWLKCSPHKTVLSLKTHLVSYIMWCSIKATTVRREASMSRVGDFCVLLKPHLEIFMSS